MTPDSGQLRRARNDQVIHGMVKNSRKRIKVLRVRYLTDVARTNRRRIIMHAPYPPCYDPGGAAGMKII